MPPADLVVTFTRGLAVMERAYRNPRHLEKMSHQFVRILLLEAGRRSPWSRERSIGDLPLAECPRLALNPPY